MRDSRTFESSSWSLLEKDWQSSARRWRALLRNYMKAGCQHPTFDELRVATIHHPPAKVEGASAGVSGWAFSKTRLREGASGVRSRDPEAGEPPAPCRGGQMPSVAGRLFLTFGGMFGGGSHYDIRRFLL